MKFHMKKKAIKLQIIHFKRTKDRKKYMYKF